MPDLTDLVGSIRKMAEAQADKAHNADHGTEDDGASRSKPEDTKDSGRFVLFLPRIR